MQRCRDLEHRHLSPLFSNVKWLQITVMPVLYLYAPLWTRMNIRLGEMVNWLWCPTWGWSKSHTVWARFEQPAPAPDHSAANPLSCSSAQSYRTSSLPVFRDPYRDFWPHFWVTCCVSLVEIWGTVLLPHRIWEAS